MSLLLNIIMSGGLRFLAIDCVCNIILTCVRNFDNTVIMLVITNFMSQNYAYSTSRYQNHSFYVVYFWQSIAITVIE